MLTDKQLKIGVLAFITFLGVLIAWHLLVSNNNQSTHELKESAESAPVKPECACKEQDARNLVENRMSKIKNVIERSTDPNDIYVPRMNVYVLKVEQRPDCSFLADIRIKYVYSPLTEGLLIHRKPEEKREMRVKCDGVSVYLD